MPRSLRHGRQSVAIPGPSVIPDRVLAAMNQAMPNIYEGELVDTSKSVLADLPAVARTQGDAFVTISNGHGAWEMALTNTLSRGDKVLVLESGRFAVGWGQLAGTSGVEVETLPGSDRAPVDPGAVEERLKADSGHTIKAVLVVQVDTASSVRNDIRAIRAAMDAAKHPALFMVDCIASLACERFEMDEWGVDVTVAGSQKGLMVPPGLGFVWANAKAMAAHQHADLRTGYWDWGTRGSDGPHYLKYCGTPPIQHVYALRVALDMLTEEGLENVWWRHEVLGGAVHAAVEAWSSTGDIGFNIESPQARSNAVTTVLTGALDPNRLRALVEREAGLVLGIALAGFDGAFRIGHMGHLNPPMLLGTLGTIESALVSMGVSVGASGVAAAAAHIGAQLDQGAV
ncbi:MAG: aminotransferase class V-fold PLP-dependent enzyme [Gammaproteobacteria bacterium]|nr:aminotransferase class V-fold PLP-dependent enzyme [Gammaproteobacteria bacterium]